MGRSERIVDAIVAGIGSTRFLVVQTAIVAAWVAYNIVGLARHFDPYPFILLNLAFSTQAAYATPLILLSERRREARDEARDDRTAAQVSEMYDTLVRVHDHLKGGADGADV